MKHFIYFKFGRVYFEKVYELYGDYGTAQDFLECLNKQYNCKLIMCEVL